MGDSMILLNKTQVYGTGRNGDSKLLVNLQQDVTGGHSNYTSWIYPSEQLAMTGSATGRYNWPEIIEPCPEYMAEKCGPGVTNGCGFVVGVVGMDDRLSSYRLKGFYGSNKLKLGVPATDSYQVMSEGQGFMSYYWFVINDTILDAGAQFDYQVSVGTQRGENPDLYVTLMDGRLPTPADWDLMSNMQGADSVRIASNMTIWDEHGWNTTAGVVVVVGVWTEARTTPYSLILTSDATQPKQLTRINLDQSLEVSNPEGGEAVYQLYNWGHKDILVTLNMNQGAGTLMYQRTGQNDYDNNIYTAIPMGKNNSLVYSNLVEG